MAKKYKGGILGILKLQPNHCTKQMSIHPIINGVWFLFPERNPDGNNAKRNYFASGISFSKRQLWSVYYYHFKDTHGWCVERNGLFLRMPVDVFEKYFGNYHIVQKWAEEEN